MKSQVIINFDALHQSRRSANYTPSVWKYDFLESLNSKYDRDEYKKQAEELKDYVKGVFLKTEDLQAKLELIDDIRRLGLAYHFEEEIQKALGAIASTYKNNKHPALGEDLYLTSLYFKLLRQHGHQVSQDIFSGFMDDMAVTEKSDIKAMVELLDASHVALEGEKMLDQAKVFTTEGLKRIIISTSGNNINDKLYFAKHAAHALELPSHWRVEWFDVKWQTKAYDHKDYNSGHIAVLVNLAKLNFNIVQVTLQKDLKKIISWWKNLGLTEKLNFARDRLVESFMCTVGLAFQPQHKCLRKCLTKVVSFILIVDDVYDLYGSLAELHQFTDAVDRWDVKETDQLPDCMKICFQALYKAIDEIANDIETENGWKLVLPHLQKVWADFCKALFVEANWYHKGYIPSFQEYLNNGWISSSGPLLLLHSFFSITQEVDAQEMSDFLMKNQDLIYNVSLIIRLCNDIGTSTAEQERGDAPSSIPCYMQEMNVTEDIARKHIQDMIAKIWQKINKKCLTMPASTLSSSFINITLNAARVAHSLYQTGDAFGDQVTESRTQILSLLVEPLTTNMRVTGQQNQASEIVDKQPPLTCER